MSGPGLCAIGGKYVTSSTPTFVRTKQDRRGKHVHKFQVDIFTVKCERDHIGYYHYHHPCETPECERKIWNFTEWFDENNTRFKEYE